jgi:predicted molibdopterin-dependent oxidoreductase YjgC
MTSSFLPWVIHERNSSKRRKGFKLLLDWNPDDAAKLGVRDGQRMRVISKRAELTALTRLTSCVKPGEVYLGRVNQLTHASFDPHSRQPSYKHSAVRVEAYKMTPGS